MEILDGEFWMVDLSSWTYSLPTVSARKGRSIIAQQFTAGTRKRLVPFDKSRRDGRKPTRRAQPSLRDGKTNCRTPTLPSDESLGYCQATLRVETLAVFTGCQRRIADFGWWTRPFGHIHHPPSNILCPLSPWERVRVRAAFGTFIHAANRPHPRPLSQRERGVFLVYWPLTTGH